MRYLILSDMHANWEAFETVLRRARRKRYEAVLVLGDLVGYGAAPNQVVDAVRRMGPRLYTVRGNHDKVVAGIDSGGNFNQTALTAAQWTTGRLTPGNLRYVRDLPQGPMKVEEGVAAPVIFLSARAQDDDRERGYALGVVDYVTKPFDPAQLVEVVRRALSGGGAPAASP